MFKKENLKGFVSGVIVTMLITTGVYAEPVKKTLGAVYNNIKIIVDGNEVEPMDSTGQKVEPFIVAGTTYLPVRAIAEALGQPVEWDDKNNTVIIGKEEIKPTEPSTIGISEGIITPYERMVYLGPDRWNRNSPSLRNNDVFITSNTTKNFEDFIYVRQKKYDISNAIYLKENSGKAGQTYLLDGNYSKMTASFAVDDRMTPENDQNESFVSFYGDGEFLGEHITQRGYAPYSIEIDLVGVDEFKIIIEDHVPLGTSGTLFNGILYDLKFKEVKR